MQKILNKLHCKNARFELYTLPWHGAGQQTLPAEKYPTATLQLNLRTAVLKVLQTFPAPTVLRSTQTKSKLKREIFRKLILTIAIYTADFAFYRAVAECKYLIDQTFTNTHFFYFSPNSFCSSPKSSSAAHTVPTPYKAQLCSFPTATILTPALQSILYCTHPHCMMPRSFREVYLNQNKHKLYTFYFLQGYFC